MFWVRSFLLFVFSLTAVSMFSSFLPSFLSDCLSVFLSFSFSLSLFLSFLLKLYFSCTQTHQKRASDLITDDCESPCGCWELNSGPLEEQPVLLTTEPSLQSLLLILYLIFPPVLSVLLKIYFYLICMYVYTHTHTCVRMYDVSAVSYTSQKRASDLPELG